MSRDSNSSMTNQLAIDKLREVHRINSASSYFKLCTACTYTAIAIRTRDRNTYTALQLYNGKLKSGDSNQSKDWQPNTRGAKSFECNS